MDKEVLYISIKKLSEPHFSIFGSSYELVFNNGTWYYSSFRKCVCRLVALLVLKYLWDE